MMRNTPPRNRALAALFCAAPLGDVPDWSPARLPLAFVENRGQWETPARFVARRADFVASLEPGALALRLEGGIGLRLVFECASEDVALVGEGEQEGIHNFFLGNDPSRWRVEVPAYDAVVYRDLHDGIDLRVREESGRLEYDLLLEPGADLGRVSIRCEGIERLGLDADGSLLMRTSLGPVRQSPPRTWQVLPDGDRRPVASRFRVIDENRFGFEADSADPDLPLVVDPGIEWATFFGGSMNERALAVAVLPGGDVAVAGETDSLDLPAAPGVLDPTFNGGGVRPNDAFVFRLDPTGSTLLYATYLGGSDNDSAGAVFLGATGEVTVAGTTESANFPATPGAFDTTYNGGGGGPLFGGDVFVARLSATGSALVWSTFLGGADREIAASLTVSLAAEATLAGEVHSTDFPVTPGAFDTTHNGGGADGFALRLNASGTGLLFSTYLGGSGSDTLRGVTLVAGDPVVGGTTESADWPATPGAFDTTFAGPAGVGDAAISRLNGAGTALLFSTFLGGTGSDAVAAIGHDIAGAPAVVGRTLSADFPATVGALDTTLGGAEDAFAARLDVTGSVLLYSTYLGGSAADSASAVAIAFAGEPTIVGVTSSADFPTTAGSFGTSGTGLFAARLAAAGNALVYSGVASCGAPLAVALDGTDAATIAGAAESCFAATPGAFDTTYNGGTVPAGDAFVSRIDFLPAGATKFGVSTTGCFGMPAVGVNSIPSVGNAGFAVTCVNAPTGGFGLLGISLGSLPAPVPVLGFGLWLDPTTFILVFPLVAGPLGSVAFPLSIPPIPALAGGGAFFQFIWTDVCAPLGFSASNALAVVVQP